MVMKIFGADEPGSILVLDFEGKKIRFVGTSEKPAWLAADVCKVLGIVNPSQAIHDFEDDERGICHTYTNGLRRVMATVYEPGLYRLIFKSKKPDAKRFRKWVTSEVLPCLRKHGTYPPPEASSYRMTLKPYTSRVVWVMQCRRALERGHWCVFIEGAEILIGAEHIFGPAELEMKQYDLLDGSIGKHWANFRKGKSWAGERVPYSYTFPKDDPRGTVAPWSYPMQELEHFKVWLHGEYWTVHMPAYIKRKYGAASFNKALPIFAGLGVPMLPPGLN
jgi:prophage antirepressor-like protein